MLTNEQWKQVAKLSNQHGYMSGVDRMSDRVKQTGEVFTPTALVIDMIKHIGIDNFAPGMNVLDNSCGDGQFLVVVKYIKTIYFKMSEEDALDDIYGVDIMRDNVDMCKMRLGGGNIVMGDTMNPSKRLDGQTDYEHTKMKEWFENDKLLGLD